MYKSKVKFIILLYSYCKESYLLGDSPPFISQQYSDFYFQSSLIKDHNPQLNSN
jgi:hypothetical protein